MENLGQGPRGSTVGAVPVQTSYWLVTDVARPRSETGDLIIVGKKEPDFSLSEPLLLQCGISTFLVENSVYWEACSRFFLLITRNDIPTTILI